MAQAQRDAERAVGLDASLDAFRTVARPMQDSGKALAARLDEVLAAVQAVDGGALARIADAERAMLEAATRAQTAEAERERAHRDRQAALADRTRAQQAAEDADRRAAAARREADERIGAALERIATLEREHGQAQAHAAAALAAQAEDARRREDAEQRATVTQAELRDLRGRLDSAHAEQGRLHEALQEATGRATAAETQQTRLTDQTEQLRAQLATLIAERDDTARHAEADLQNIRIELDSARSEAGGLAQQLAVATAATDAANARASRAESQVDQLLAALSQPTPGDDDTTN
jgi:chromosome segregation ATPase